MKKAGILFIVMWMGLHATAQKLTGRISGSVFSDSGLVAMEGASVTLQNPADSSVEKIVLTDKKGAFAFTGLRLGDYLLLVTVLNHLPFETKVGIQETLKELVVDSIKMRFSAASLATVTVVTLSTPVKLMGDTTEYNAGSFKTKENAMVEDLLKKLPGIEVSKDGTLKSNGEKITQILVDGQPFFGDDPKMATQNLPANIIAKIQVIDEKSEKARMTKVEDGVRNKVINIIIKKDKKKGYFGRTYFGYGTSATYEGKLSANYFNGNKKLSFVTGESNTGRNDYGSDNDRAYYNNNSGISKDAQAKLNYSDKWGKYLNVNANLGYSRNQNTSIQTRNRQNIFGDSSTFYNESSQSIRNRNGFNAGVSVEYKPDTLTSLRFNGSANVGKNIFYSSALFNSTLLQNKKINDGNRANRGLSESPSFTGNLSVSHRFKKSKRALFFSLNNNFNSNLGDNFNISNNYFYPVNVPEYQRLLNQYTLNNSHSASTNTSLSYSLPAGKKSSLSINLGYSFSANNTLRELFNYNIQSGLYDLFNDTLSSDFNTHNSNASIGTNYSYSVKKGTLAFGASWQNSRSKSISLSRDSVYQQHFNSLVPYISFNRYTNGKSFNLYYNFNSVAPQAYQLQPVLDNSNPLFLRLGNPNLKYSSTHRLTTSLNRFNAKNNSSIYFNGNLSLIANNFSTSTVYDKLTGSQTTRPVNVNGVYRAGGNLSYNRPFKVFKQTIQWNANSNLNLNRNISEIDHEKNINRSVYATVSSGIDIEISDWLEVGANYNFNIQNTRYSLRPAMSNSSYTNGGTVRGEVNPGKLTEIRFDWTFSNNTGRSAGFNRKINLVNADLTQYFNKKKNYWLQLKAYDLLKQNVSIYRNSGENYIEDTRMNVLNRFFLLSLNFKLNKFGGKPKPAG